MDGKWIKIIGLTASVVSVGASLVTNWVNEKKFDEKVTQKVTETLANMAEKTETN